LNQLSGNTWLGGGFVSWRLYSPNTSLPMDMMVCGVWLKRDANKFLDLAPSKSVAFHVYFVAFLFSRTTRGECSSLFRCFVVPLKQCFPNEILMDIDRPQNRGRIVLILPQFTSPSPDNGAKDERLIASLVLWLVLARRRRF
jgi:hypothetical protein